MIVYRDVVVGVRKRTLWYQYGLDKPQGPIDAPDTDLDPKRAVLDTRYRWLADRALREPGIPVPPASHKLVLLFTRGWDRKILNEDELLGGLREAYAPRGYQVRKVAFEKSTSRDLVALLQRAHLVVGMHGSMLSLAGLAEKTAHTASPRKTTASTPGCRNYEPVSNIALG